MTTDPGPKGRLLRTAAELFARHGYAGVTVRAVAVLAGANVAAVSYHFGGKDRLYAEVVRLACREMGTAPPPHGTSDGSAVWWAKLLGHELLRDGPHAAEVAAAVRRAAAADRSDGSTRHLLAVAGLMAVTASTRQGTTGEEAEAAWAALDSARRSSRPSLSPGVMS